MSIRQVAVRLGMVLIVGVTATGWGADEEQSPASKSTNSTAFAELEKEWDDLVTQRNKVSKQIQLLQQEFGKANPERRQQIQDEYMKLVESFQKKSLARMEEILPTLAKTKYQQYIKNPDDEKSQTIVEEYLQMAFHGKKRYSDVASLGIKLIDAGRTTPLILNLTGAACFCNNQFDRAQQILKQAEKERSPEGRQMFEQIGARFLVECDDYLGYWKKEAAIREAEKNAPKEKQNPRVLFKTSKGDVEIELYEDQAPNTVANFISLIEKGKYDNVGFHRVIPDFMAQGGDPNTLDKNPGNDGGGGPGYTIKCECGRPDTRMHFTGSLSMAHAGKDTGGSQFFITYLPTSHLNKKHTVFGRVVKGMDAVNSFTVGEPVAPSQQDRILSAKVLSKRDHDYVPVTEPDRRRGRG